MTQSPTLLVTGGAGYIGSHTVVHLANNGYRIVVLDNLSNSNPLVFERLTQIIGQPVTFVHGDIRDAAALAQLFQTYAIDAVIHFAGLKAVGEGESNPLHYYDNNVYGSLLLLQTMVKAGVNTLIFSSSATVYGDPGYSCYTEETPLAPFNTYGHSKAVVERIICSTQKAHPQLSVALLRYFNPIGAHRSGLIGENPSGIPNNLLPYIAQVATGRLDKLVIYGNDYPTPDGTGMRDYIHVEDLALGHVKALEAVHNQQQKRLIVNLGTGRPHSVLEVVAAFERACGFSLPYVFAARRPGDLAKYYAEPTLARHAMGWHARYTLDDMCQDSWRWQKNNPEGYAASA